MPDGILPRSRISRALVMGIMLSCAACGTGKERRDAMGDAAPGADAAPANAGTLSLVALAADGEGIIEIAATSPCLRGITLFAGDVNPGTYQLEPAPRIPVCGEVLYRVRADGIDEELALTVPESSRTYRLLFRGPVSYTTTIRLEP